MYEGIGKCIGKGVGNGIRKCIGKCIGKGVGNGIRKCIGKCIGKCIKVLERVLNIFLENILKK